MNRSRNLISRYRDVLNILNAQHRVLVQAGASKELLDAYRAVVRYLARIPQSEIARIVEQDPVERREKRAEMSMSPSEVAQLSLEQVEELIDEKNTTRRTLEVIAIGRFQVPRGSMRSFSSIGMLKEKLRTLVQNERAHRTISSVAQHPRSG